MSDSAGERRVVNRRSARRAIKRPSQYSEIKSIGVEGFKSHFKNNRIEVGPLTVLAGANSSGKTSIMQPLLLMKQTLEASYDPGTFLLGGPHVNFSSIDQILSSAQKGFVERGFSVEIETEHNYRFRTEFCVSEEHELGIKEAVITHPAKGSGKKSSIVLSPIDTSDEIENQLSESMSGVFSRWYQPPEDYELAVVERRCFLVIAFRHREDRQRYDIASPQISSLLLHSLMEIIHVPAFRGNPKRSYPVTSGRLVYPGTFENYIATLIVVWESSKRSKLHELENMLRRLRLTQFVTARPVDANSIEINVGRRPGPGGPVDRDDYVNIADVGFGVSQVLPILVALLAAGEGQMVYIEQPELHLHPKAQYEMARFIAEAVKRGVRVVVETHSALLVLSLRTLVAKEKVDRDAVRLYWFERDEGGETHVRPGLLNERGASSDWPADFSEVELNAAHAYIQAASPKLPEES